MLLLLKGLFCYLCIYYFLPTTRIKEINFFVALSIFLYTLLFWVFYNHSTTILFQSVSCWSFLGFYSVCFGVDQLSLFFIVLTGFIHFLCVLSSLFSVKKNFSNYCFCLFLIEFFLIGAFSVLDFFVFYLLFESVLIPMFFLIGFWGSNVRKMKAAYYLFLYTLFGSLFLLFSLILIGFQVGTFNWYFLFSTEFSAVRELLLWPGIFIAFAIKVPMFPFHIWLPEAHVEAPTGGSVILASLLLKLGAFGFLRYLLPLFPLGTFYYSALISLFALLGVFYASFVALRQIDLKRIIAYSSVAHMNFGILGLFSTTYEGLLGGYFLMLGHGFISGALFFLVGVIYDRYKTRISLYYSGLALRMPMFAAFFFLFTIANIGFPGTMNFISEFLIILGVALSNFVLVVILLTSLFFTTIFTFWLYNRVVFGNVRVFNNIFFYDLTRAEFYILLFLFLPTLFFGLWPTLLLDAIDLSLYLYLF